MRASRNKPIRVFYSDLSRRFYASRAYKELESGIVEITGDKFDVTNDIAELIERHNLVFRNVTLPGDATAVPERPHPEPLSKESKGAPSTPTDDDPPR